MGETIPIYDYPEFNETFNELFDKLLNESGRGALLIGTSYVEEHLEKFILKVLPNNQKKYTSRLLNYPGPLSSFSAKLELSYAFRLIPEETYNSLNNLRKFRNEAAHSSKDFCLSKIDIDTVFNLGEGWRTMISKTSAEMMLKMKTESLKISLSEIDGMDEEKINEYISSKFQEKESLEILEKQWPHWKLIIGLSLICGILRFYSDETMYKLGKSKTWSNIKNNS
jgi:DNA-binding MltR family transcriptional regulator